MTQTVKPMLKRADVCKLLNISDRTLDRWREEGVLPNPVTPPKRHPRWDADEVADWIKAGMPARHKWTKIKEAR